MPPSIAQIWYIIFDENPLEKKFSDCGDLDRVILKDNKIHIIIQETSITT